MKVGVYGLDGWMDEERREAEVCLVKCVGRPSLPSLSIDRTGRAGAGNTMHAYAEYRLLAVCSGLSRAMCVGGV